MKTKLIFSFIMAMLLVISSCSKDDALVKPDSGIKSVVKKVGDIPVLSGGPPNTDPGSIK